MDDIDRIKGCWTVPKNWTVKIDESNMEVFDAESDHVVTAMTRIHIIEKINEHVEAQESWTAFKMMEASLKDPIEA